MTASLAGARVQRSRLALGVGAVAAALLWAVAAAAVVWAVAGLFDWAVELPIDLRRTLRAAAAALGAAAALAALWRAGAVWSRRGVALWIEERTPALRYALVTALEPQPAGIRDELERRVAGARWDGALSRAIGRAVMWPSAVLLAALGAVLVLPAGIVARIAAPRPGDALDHPAGAAARAGNRLVRVAAVVTPPQYSGLPSATLDDPSRIGALAASSIQIEGRGLPAGLTARLGDAALRVTGDAARWHIIFAMPRRATALRLHDGSAQRLIALEPRPDSAPVVTLAAPARDTVVSAPRGTVRLAARAVDDFGLASVWLEYIVSSGEGETFTFRSGVIRRAAVRGARQGALAAPLVLDSLGLHPGDVVHVRAAAADGNVATGPDTGVSETRTLRVARAGELDSVAVDAAPPPAAAQSELSERMLIQLTEALERRRASLPRATLAGEASRIARDQSGLRRRVGALVFARLGRDTGGEESSDTLAGSTLTPEQLLRAADAATSAGTQPLDFEGDESPVVAANRPLLEAYDAMWAAERALGIADTRGALPHMYAALRAIERARAAERLYLRGGAVPAVVDIARVRLAGSPSDAAPAPRTPRSADGGAVRTARRFDAALEALRRDPGAAVDSLLLLRLDVLQTDAPLAAALGGAIDALRGGRDATAALAAARRRAAGWPAPGATVPDWSAAW